MAGLSLLAEADLEESPAGNSKAEGRRMRPSPLRRGGGFAAGGVISEGEEEDEDEQEEDRSQVIFLWVGGDGGWVGGGAGKGKYVDGGRAGRAWGGERGEGRGGEGRRGVGYGLGRVE